MSIISARFAGQSHVKLWGLPLSEWQKRAFLKAGASDENEPEDGVVINVHWVLSPALAKAFVGSPKTALIVDDVIIGTNGVSALEADELIGLRLAYVDLAKFSLVPKKPDELTGSYDKALRKIEEPYALDTRITDSSTIMKRQYASSYKGITDFVTKFVWPVPAYYFTRACANLKISPNSVTTLSLIMTFLAMYYFWHGQWALGFLTGWFMTFLDTVDGKLARTTMTYSTWGNVYDHGIDLIHPPFWYWAWYMGLGGNYVWPDMMSFALAAIIVGYIVGRILEGIFLAQHGFYVHVWRPVNSLMRFITARRNPNMFIFMMAILFLPVFPQAGVWGFFAVAFWTWFCNIFDMLSIVTATLTRKPVTSWLDADA